MPGLSLDALSADDEVLRRLGDWNDAGPIESGLGQHLLMLARGISVARGSKAEHNETEGGWDGRTYSIVVRNEFPNQQHSALGKRAKTSLNQLHAVLAAFTVNHVPERD